VQRRLVQRLHHLAVQHPVAGRVLALVHVLHVQRLRLQRQQVAQDVQVAHGGGGVQRAVAVAVGHVQAARVALQQHLDRVQAL